MAEMFVSGMDWTIQKLSSLLLSETPTSSSSAPPSEGATTALEDLKKLERTMKQIQAVLAEAHERDIRDYSERYRLQELKEVAYDAEDVVGDYEYDVLHAKIEARDRMLGLAGGITNRKERVPLKVIDLDSIKVSAPVSDGIAGRVKVIRDRFEEITRDWESLRLSDSDAPRRKNFNAFTRPPTSSLVQESTIHGRDEDRDNIIYQLLSEDGNSKNGTVSVDAIVGMGGIGKTTLAQLVYNDPRVCDHFELKGWVCVSENFDVVVLTTKIIEYFTKRSCELRGLDNLQCELRKIVSGERFFLVLDDVWNENPSVWHSLLVPLTFAKSGIILVTTRTSVVAKIMQTKPYYKLPDLNPEACWSLFQQLAFYHNEKDADKHLIEIAKGIVAKCCGLPLAVTMIGSALCYEDDIQSWTDILESNELGSNTGNSDFLPVLKLSYDHMPSHLKRCFASFALFPKDYCFQEDGIIKLWMSVGLIHPSNGKKVEDIGRAYIKELQERSMITPSHTSLLGDQQGFVIHDLLHDLAQEVAKDELIRLEPKVENDWHHAKTEIPSQLTTKVLYMSIVLNPKAEIHLKHYLGLTNQMRAVVAHVVDRSWASMNASIRINNEVFQHMKYVRALDLSYTDITSLPESVGNLKQLHYLNLSRTSINFLPDSVCYLYNLEILELTGCFHCRLPDGVRKLTKLRHLNLDAFESILSRRPGYPTPYGIGLLTNLQSLSLFVVGNNSSESDICELKDLVYLSESLTIRGLENVTNINHANEANLRKKQYLCSLTLDLGEPNTMINGVKFEEQLLEILEPHPNLENLKIEGYGGSKFPKWVGDISFSKLVRVKLVNFASELVALGQLPSIKVVEIRKALNMRILDLRSCDNTLLEVLTISYCEKLESVVELRSLTSLKKLMVEFCPKLHLNPERDFPPSIEGYNCYMCGGPDRFKLPTSKPESPKPRPCAMHEIKDGTPAKKKCCNCRHSRCLKLYCECFASGVYCDGCNCTNCFNNVENEAARRDAMDTILERYQMLRMRGV